MLNMIEIGIRDKVKAFTKNFFLYSNFYYSLACSSFSDKISFMKYIQKVYITVKIKDNPYNTKVHILICLLIEFLYCKFYLVR